MTASWSDKRLTLAAIAAAGRLHVAGIAFSICSNRPPFGQRMLIAPLRLALPFGGYNGGLIVNPDLSPVEQKLLSPDAAHDTIAMLEHDGISSIWVFTGGGWQIRDRAGDHVDLEIHTIETPPTVVDSFDGRLDAVSKIVGASKDHDRIATAVSAGRDALRGRATVLRSQPYYCDVTPPGIGKGRLVDLLPSAWRCRARRLWSSATWQRRRDVPSRRLCDRDGQRDLRSQGAGARGHIVKRRRRFCRRDRPLHPRRLTDEGRPNRRPPPFPRSPPGIPGSPGSRPAPGEGRVRLDQGGDH